MRTRGNIAVLGLPGVIALCFLYSFALTYMTGDLSQFGIYRQRHTWLLAHVIAGTVALLFGPLQLWLGLNRRTAIPHRILGVIYVLSVAIGSTSAFNLAFHTDFGWVFAIGFTSMGAAWVITTTFATMAICLHRVEQHREWMIRSYVVTFGFVTFRILEVGLDLAHVGTIVERMTAASWLAWTVPLLITESILQGWKIFGKAAAANQFRPASAYPAAPTPISFEPRDAVMINTSSIKDRLSS
jgi:hypothetical protein